MFDYIDLKQTNWHDCHRYGNLLRPHLTWGNILYNIESITSWVGLYKKKKKGVNKNKNKNKTKE